jgi:hypothetical protein
MFLSSPSPSLPGESSIARYSQGYLGVEIFGIGKTVALLQRIHAGLLLRRRWVAGEMEWRWAPSTKWGAAIEQKYRQFAGFETHSKRESS